MTAKTLTALLLFLLTLPLHAKTLIETAYESGAIDRETARRGL